MNSQKQMMARGSCPKFRVENGGVGLVFGSLAVRGTVIPDAVQHDNDALLIRDPKYAVSRDQVPCLQSTELFFRNNNRCQTNGLFTEQISQKQVELLHSKRITIDARPRFLKFRPCRQKVIVLVIPEEAQIVLSKFSC